MGLRSGPRPEGGTRNRYPYLDGLRACAALFVYLHHALLQVAEHRNGELGGWWVLEILRPGRYAVDAFIFLSGYCLMLPVLQRGGHLESTRRFYIKRAIRILPTYYAGLALSLLLIWGAVGVKTGTHWDYALPVSVPALWTHLLLIQDVFPDTFSKINHAYWSISVESRIYLLFPLLVALRSRWGSFAVVGLSWTLSVLVTLALRRWSVSTDLTSWYVGLFSMGMLACELTSNPKWREFALTRKSAFTLGALSLFAIAVWGFEGKFGSREGLPTYVQSFLVGLGMLLLVVRIQDGNAVERRILEWPPLVWVGTISYSLYLVHAPLLQIFQQYAFKGVSSDTEMLCLLSTVGLAATLVLSSGFYWLFERPVLSPRTRKQVRMELDVVEGATAAEPGS